MTDRIIAIWNPASGSAPDPDELRDGLGPGVELVETTADDPGIGQAADAARQGAEAVIACGGDGTIRACLEGVIGTGVPLGLIPLGTGNLLATNLGVPDGIVPARDVVSRRRRRIDLGRVNGEVFAVMAGTGFDARMIRDAEDNRKDLVGSLAYVAAGVKNVPSSLVPTRVAVDGARWFSGRTSMVLVGNLSTVTGGLDVFPQADPTDGRLDVGALRAESVRDWLTVGYNLVRNRPQPGNLVERIQGERVTITTDSARPYELDGEERPETTMLEIEIAPAAVEIFEGAGR